MFDGGGDQVFLCRYSVASWAFGGKAACAASVAVVFAPAAAASCALLTRAPSACSSVGSSDLLGAGAAAPPVTGAPDGGAPGTAGGVVRAGGPGTSAGRVAPGTPDGATVGCVPPAYLRRIRLRPAAAVCWSMPGVPRTAEVS